MNDPNDIVKLIPVTHWDMASLRNSNDLVLVLTLPQKFDASHIDGTKLHFRLSQQNISGILESLQSKLDTVVRDPKASLN